MPEHFSNEPFFDSRDEATAERLDILNDRSTARSPARGNPGHAGDLRAVVGSMQNVADAERMGGLALPEEVNGYFAEMGTIAVDLGLTARDVVLSFDPRRAAQIRHDDDEMDDLHRPSPLHHPHRSRRRPAPTAAVPAETMSRKSWNTQPMT